MENADMPEVLMRLAKKGTEIQGRDLIAAMCGIVRSCEEDTEELKRFVKATESVTREELVRMAVVMACDSIAVSLWKSLDSPKRESDA